MNHFDDIQVEELENFDFCFDGLFDEEEKDAQSFNSYLNSNIDY